MSRRTARLDRDVAALLSANAFVEIRYTANKAGRLAEEGSVQEDLEHIRFLANLCHNLPEVTRPSRRPLIRRGARTLRERASAERPMSSTWNSVGPEGRAWILHRIEAVELSWTPPPPIPDHLERPRPLTVRQRIGILLRR